MSEFFEEVVTPTSIDPEFSGKKGTYVKGKSYISYSQYSTWSKCPASWKFDKIEKLGKFKASIATVFGTAIHETIQKYLLLLYNNGAPVADNFDHLTCFRDSFKKELLAEMEKGVVFDTEETKEHIIHGKEILKEILSARNRVKHFPTKDTKLLGIEIELNEEVKKNLNLVSFLDIVLQDEKTGKIKIIDLKTSMFGWNKWQIADVIKLDQLYFYKRFYSEKYKVPVKDIDSYFIIFKRKTLGDSKFPQSRIQVVKPPVGTLSMNESVNRFKDFVDSCYDDDGKKRIDGSFPKVPGKNKKHCKYCPFKNMVRKDGTIVCEGKAD